MDKVYLVMKDVWDSDYAVWDYIVHKAYKDGETAHRAAIHLQQQVECDAETQYSVQVVEFDGFQP
jgi:hypothetical protein